MLIKLLAVMTIVNILNEALHMYTVRGINRLCREGKRVKLSVKLDNLPFFKTSFDN